MTKKTKSLAEKINTLPIIGTPVLVGSIVGAVVLLNSQHPSDWSPNYFYFKTLGAILGYLYMAWWNPGGRVTLNFDKATYSEDEKALYDLVVKYKSNFLMVVPLIIYVFADFTIGKVHAQTNPGTFEGYLISLIIGSGITLGTAGGVKYLSAWWNIKRNWKKNI